MPYFGDDLLAAIVGGVPVDDQWLMDDLDFHFVDNLDRSKRFLFQCSGITALNTRVLTVQDANYTIAGIDIAESFTAKQTFAIQSGPSTVIETATTLTSGLTNGNSTGIWNLNPTFSDAINGVAGIVGQRINMLVSNGLDATFRGLNLVVNVAADPTLSTGITSVVGLDFIARTSGTGDHAGGGFVRGVQGVAQHGSTGNLSTLTAINASASILTGGGNVDEMHTFFVSSSSIAALAAVTNYYGLRLLNPAGAGTITTQYGIYLPALSKGTTTWALYSLGGNSSHLGNFKFGANTVPAAKVDLAAGTATANTAPLKFTSGTSLAVPVAGVMEFTTDDLFFTITTGTERKTIAFTGAQSYAPGSFTVATEKYFIMSRHLKLTTAQRATLAGTATLRIT